MAQMDALMTETDVPAAAPAEGPGLTPGPVEHVIPLAALEMPDDTEQMAAPEVGDEVQYNVTGKVSRIEGDLCFVTPATVNGKELPGPAAGAAPEAVEGAGLRSEAGGFSPGLLAVLLLFLLPVLVVGASRYFGDASLRHSLTVSTRPVRLIEVRGHNNTASDVYIQVLPYGSISNGLTPVVSELAFAGLPYVLRFNQPLALDACSIAASTCLNLLTNTTGANATDKVTILVQIEQ